MGGGKGCLKVGGAKGSLKNVGGVRGCLGGN